MSTKDLQRIDELVHVADMAVRVASQLRLWMKRGDIRDQESIDDAIRFLDEAVRGGRFVDTGELIAGSSSLYPLTWSADVRFGSAGQLVVPPTSIRYDELVMYLDTLRETLAAVRADQKPSEESIISAATFFDQLGRFIGSKADSALRSPAGGTQLLQERFSYQ